MSEADPADPDILRDEDPPGEWRHRTVGGRGITYALPLGVSVDGFDPADDEWVELVLEQTGDLGDDDRPVDVWAVAYNPDMIIWNWSDAGTDIGRASDMDRAAKIAVEYMKSNPGV